MKLSRVGAYFLGVGTGIILCLLVTFERTGIHEEGMNTARRTRSTQSVIWIPDSTADERVIHDAMGRPPSEVLAIVGIPDRDVIDRLPRRFVDEETIDRGWMKVEGNQFYAVKCRGADDVIVFGEVFGHMAGYHKFPGSPFVNAVD
jgi:hypothetical protein